MKTYSEREVFDERDLSAFEHARQIVEVLPDYDQEGEQLRCHEVAALVGKILELPVRHGKYELGSEHSWLELPSRHILDVYAVGRIPPVQLVARVAAMPLRYREMDIDLELRTETLYFLESRRPA
jgi:hypothetical protein